MINMRDICTHTSPSLRMLMLVTVYNDGRSGGGGGGTHYQRDREVVQPGWGMVVGQMRVQMP